MNKTPFPLPEEIETWPVFWRELAGLPDSNYYERQPKNIWEWGDPSDGYTAILHGGEISWNWHGPKDFGNTIEQSVLDFVAFGPDESTVPEGVPWEIFLQIRSRDFARWPKLLAEARALELKLTPPEARYSADDTVRRRAEVLGVEEVPAPLYPLLWQGLGVIAGSVVITCALAAFAPLLAKYASLFLPLLIGFAAALRSGSLALIVAGFFGLAAGLASQFAIERYYELSSGIHVTLASITEIPRHPTATRFSVSEVRPLPDLSARYERRVYLRSGAGPSPQITHLYVAPLVPANWNRSDPVPAWLACKTSPGFDCLKDAARSTTGLIRVRGDDAGDFRVAAAAAETRHQIKSAREAPILESNSDPLGAPSLYLALAALIPLVVYLLWATGVLGWRAFRTARS